MYRLTAPTLIALSFATLASTARAQEPDVQLRALSLDEAVALALEGNADLAVAEARRDLASNQGRKAASSLWPQLALESGYVRSVDPVAVFGTKLRQGRFGPEDLDFAVLNNPEAIDDWSTALGLRWSILDPKIWAGRAAARHQAEAADWSAARTREATILVTRMLYYRAQTATSQLGAAEAALEAASATVQSFRLRPYRHIHNHQ